ARSQAVVTKTADRLMAIWKQANGPGQPSRQAITSQRTASHAVPAASDVASAQGIVTNMPAAAHDERKADCQNGITDIECVRAEPSSWRRKTQRVAKLASSMSVAWAKNTVGQGNASAPARNPQRTACRPATSTRAEPSQLRSAKPYDAASTNAVSARSSPL